MWDNSKKTLQNEDGKLKILLLQKKILLLPTDSLCFTPFSKWSPTPKHLLLAFYEGSLSFALSLSNFLPLITEIHTQRLLFFNPEKNRGGMMGGERK